MYIVRCFGFDLPNRARTARTYPVGAAELARTVEEALRRLGRWETIYASEGEVQAVRQTRLGFEDEITVRLTRLESGAHTNTHARFESTSHLWPWDLGQNLRKLLEAVDQELR